jgi:hypothetical protein
MATHRSFPLMVWLAVATLGLCIPLVFILL